jgi:ATP-dependent protease ClpP protease subunit
MSKTPKGTRTADKERPAGPTKDVFFDGKVTVESMRSLREQIIAAHNVDQGATAITLFIHSSGGEGDAALALGEYLRVRGISLDTVVLDRAESSAVILFMLGKRRSMGKNAHLFLHLGRRSYEQRTTFTAKEFGQNSLDMERQDRKFADWIATAVGEELSTVAVLKLMKKDMIIVAAYAQELGLATEILP